MTSNDETIKQLKELVIRLERRVAYLERENSRRKNEHNTIANTLRRG